MAQRRETERARENKRAITSSSSWVQKKVLIIHGIELISRDSIGFIEKVTCVVSRRPFSLPQKTTGRVRARETETENITSFITICLQLQKVVQTFTGLQTLSNEFIIPTGCNTSIKIRKNAALHRHD